MYKLNSQILLYKYISLALERGKSGDYLLIFECESGHENGNLISCCRYRLVDKLLNSKSSTSFVLLIHLPKKCLKSNFVSFQEQPWICYHVDDILSSDTSLSLADLVCPEEQLLSELYLHEYETYTRLLKLQQQSLKDVPIDWPFKLKPVSSEKFMKGSNLCGRMHLYICDAVLQSHFESEPGRLKRLTELIPKNPTFPLSGCLHST